MLITCMEFYVGIVENIVNICSIYLPNRNYEMWKKGYFECVENENFSKTYIYVGKGM